MFGVQHIRRRVMEAWRRERLDAVICPAAAFPALPLKSAELLQSEHCLLQAVWFKESVLKRAAAH